MTRLEETFASLRRRGERALMPYFTAGDPSLDATRRLVVEAAKRGADVIELGIPFSDPVADGPVVQRAAQRALAAGVTLPRVLEMVREVRAETAVPIVFLTYYNPILAFGLEAFCRAAADAGADGVLVADLPPEEAGPLRAQADARRPSRRALRRADVDARAHEEDRAGQRRRSSTWCRSPG